MRKLNRFAIVALAALPSAALLVHAGYRKLFPEPNQAYSRPVEPINSYQAPENQSDQRPGSQSLFNAEETAKMYDIERRLESITLDILGDRYIESKPVEPMSKDPPNKSQILWEGAKPLLIKPTSSTRSYLYFDAPGGVDSVDLSISGERLGSFGLRGAGTYEVRIDGFGGSENEICLEFMKHGSANEDLPTGDPAVPKEDGE